jgi:hypothetical protein
MTKKKLSKSALSKSLRLKQREHEKLLAKIEKTSLRLERRKARAATLQAEITELEGQLSKPQLSKPPQVA